MFSKMFDGQYKSKPQVSLRGASVKEEKDVLLARVAEEREQRESSRRRQLAAVKIQSYYRGYTQRNIMYSKLRGNYDSSLGQCTSPADVVSLTHLLLLFYNPAKDQPRMIKLCQKWLQFSKDLVTVNDSRLQQLLVHCCESLASNPSQNFAVPLRMIETFLSPQLPTAAILFSHCIDSGYYFSCLRGLLEQRTPTPLGPDETTPSALVTSLLESFSRPFCKQLELGKSVFTSLAREVFSPPLSPHVTYILVPFLSKIYLNLPVFLETILIGLNSREIPPSLELLYSVLQLVNGKLSTLDESALAVYLELISLLLGECHSGHMISHNPDDYMELDLEEGDPLGTQEELEMCCVSIITGTEIAHRIKKESRLSERCVAALCSLCYHVSLRRGFDHRSFLFQRLSLQPDLLVSVWTSLTSLVISRSFGEPVSCLHQLSKGLPLPPTACLTLVQQLATFCSLFSLYLSTLHDAEFYSELEGSSIPFTLGQLSDMVPPLRDVFITLQLDKHLPTGYLGNKRIELKPSVEEWTTVKNSVHDVLCALYERDCRRPFCPRGQWAVLPSLGHIPPQLFLDNEEDEDTPMCYTSPSVLKQAELLRTAPFVFPFIERVKFFSSLVQLDKMTSQGRNQHFLMGPSIALSVRRNHIYEDAFAELAQGQDLRQKLRVSFVNAQGLDESGIDGGGLFREFLTEVLKTGCDPNRGFFCTTQDGLLYPNPHAPLISQDFSMHYKFLGSVLGKAMYEGLLVELPFAEFFLCKLANRGRGNIGVHHLASFDSELYRHLLSLKHYNGNVEDLDLNFTLVSDELGHAKVIELKRGGGEIPVTKGNCVEYIHLVSHYKLNVQLDRQFTAFRQGLSSVVPLHWLRLFSQNELQVLISGARVPINIEDLRTNTHYTGEYKDDHPVIKIFWSVVSLFSENEKQQLLKFVTSCSRPPLLGFKHLNPPLTICPGVGGERLPTASTCMNVLKLPQFQDDATLKSMLLYAIQSGAGFELS